MRSNVPPRTAMRTEQRGVPVAVHDLARDRLRRETEPRERRGLDRRIEMSERADRAGELADQSTLECCAQPLSIAARAPRST
jgi:hypothetical protein